MSERIPQVHMKLCVQDCHVRKRIINLEDASGIDSVIECFGFDKDGNPVFTDIPSIYYRLSGGYRSGVNLNSVFNPVKRGSNESGGIRLYERVKGELKEKQHLFGYEALSVFLSMKGCQITAETLQKEIERLLKDKVSNIYAVRSDQLQGLESFHDKSDCWILSGESPDSDIINYDFVNGLLQKLGSNWRIATDKTIQLLRKIELQKLMK